MTQEQKNAVRAWFLESVETLSRDIEREIADIGGRNMLLQRIDIFFWVDNAEEEVEMFQEALRVLDGEGDIDENLVFRAIQRKKDCYQETLKEIESLRTEIREKEERLKKAEEWLPQYRLSAETLQEALQEYRMHRPCAK